MTCWKCGHALDLRSGDKVSRRESCPRCDTDLRSCRNCRHYDAAAHHECRENQAEWVRDKDRNNTCDYFSPAAAGSSRSGEGAADRARASFDDLFRNQ